MHYKSLKAPLIAISLTFCSYLSLASAADIDDAKHSFHVGKELMRQKDFKNASLAFEKSIKLHVTKSGLFNLAQCYKAIGRYDKALLTLVRLKGKYREELSLRLQAEIDRQRKEIQDFVARIEIHVDKTSAIIKVDGYEIGKSPLVASAIVGPGLHVIEASLEGYKTVTREVTVLSREKREASLTLKPLVQLIDKEESVAPQTVKPIEPRTLVRVPVAPNPYPFTPSVEDLSELEVWDDEESGRKKVSGWFWGGLGATAVTGILSGIFLGLNRTKYADYSATESRLDKMEKGTPEYDELEAKNDNLGDELNKDFNRAAVLGIAAGALAITTTIILILDLKKYKTETVELTASRGGIGLRF